MAMHVPVLKFVKIEIHPGSQEPDARSGHRIAVDDGNLYSLGGYNPRYWEEENDDESNYPLFRELWQLNFATRRWQKIKTSGYMPKELASHAVLKHGTHLVVMGGTGVPFGETASNKLHVCSMRNWKWREVPCSGDPPTATYGHSMVIVDDNLFTFGGTTGWQYNADIHCLSLQSCTWQLLSPIGNPPAGRYRHEIAYYEGYLYVFGGGRSNESYDFETISVFNLASREWELRRSVPDRKNGVPRPRRCHGCVHRRQEVFLCGGYDGVSIFGDVWKIHLPTMRWTKLEAVMPEPSYFHALAITDAGQMFSYGGVVEIDKVRTPHVYSIWLEMPSLKEICWQLVTQMVPDLSPLQHQGLLETGVPTDLLARIS